MKEYRKIKYLLIVIFILTTNNLFAQIGGNLSPLKYSIHTFSILMYNESYDPEWGIYPSGTTAVEIENKTAVPLVNGTAYNQVGATWKNGGYSYYKVQFNGNMTVYDGTEGSGEYVIGYIEYTNDDFACATAVVRDFTLYPPFDVDAFLVGNVERCPGGSGVLQRGVPGSQTEVEYEVNIEYPDELGGYVEGMTWTFSFEVNITAVGSKATINRIETSGTAADRYWVVPGDIPTGSTNFIGTFEVNPSETTPVTFSIIYNDVLGSEQDISFRIYDIMGSFGELDIDEIGGGNINGNIQNVQLNPMPNVGALTVWN